MKKKIVLGLSIFAMMFFFGGIYIVKTMESTVYDLHRLSRLHHTIALRKDLAISVRKEQNAVKLMGTRFFSGEQNGESAMTAIAKQCSVCHHPAESQATIEDLRRGIETYQTLLHKVYTASPHSSRREELRETTLRMGEELIAKIESIIVVTSDNLEKYEMGILREVNYRKRILFLLVTTGPFFALGLIFILLRGLTSPVNSLLDATRRLKAGELDFRIEGLKDEFGEVAASFNEMAAALKMEMQEMQRTEQLKVSGEMAAGLAHEIRNPLAAMKLSIEVLLSELTLEEKDRAVLLKVVEEIRRVELLMKNLLNFARPAASQPMNLNINKILEDTAKFLEKHPSFSAPSRRHIVREFSSGIPDTVGDPQQLQQVFLNLLLNAAEAMPEGGAVTVKTTLDEAVAEISIEVSDTGKGISAESIGRIFQPFFTTKVKGTGLGLAVSKRLVEAQGGRIEVSGNKAGGATFKVLLPMVKKEV